MSVSIYTKFSNENELKRMVGFLEQEKVQEKLKKLISNDAFHNISEIKFLQNDLPYIKHNEKHILGINGKVSDAFFNMIIWLSSKSSYREEKFGASFPIYFVDKEKVYLMNKEQNKSLKLNVSQSIIDENGLWIKGKLTGVLKVISDILNHQNKIFEEQHQIMKEINDLYEIFNNK